MAVYNFSDLPVSGSIPTGGIALVALASLGAIFVIGGRYRTYAIVTFCVSALVWLVTRPRPDVVPGADYLDYNANLQPY